MARRRGSGVPSRGRTRWAVVDRPVPVDPPQQGNVWTFPRELENPVWGLMNATIGVNVAAGVDDTTTADKLTEDNANGQHRVFRSMLEALDNQPQVVALYAKRVERSLVAVRSVSRNGNANITIVDLDSGVVLRRDGEHAAEVRRMAAGWWWIKVELATVRSGVTEPVWHVNVLETAASLTHQGVAGRGVLLWDLQYHPNRRAAGLTPEFPEVLPGTTHLLRVGFFNGDASIGGVNLLGKGPDMVPASPSTPIYRAAMFTPELDTLDAYLDIAEANDILLVLNFAGGRFQWIVNNQFNLDAYKARVDRFANHARLRQRIVARGVIGYAHDEPQHPNFNGTLSPTLVNQSCLHHKAIWPGIIVAVRVNGETLTEGWDGAPVPGTGWTGIDYGWMQFGPQHSPAQTFAQAYAAHKALLSSVNLGMIPGLNFIDGGNTTDVDTVTACWDYAGSGASSGYLVGGGDPTGLPDASEWPCGSTSIANNTRVVSNPAWVRRAVTAAVADADAPCFMLWSHPENGSVVGHARHIALMAQANVRAGLRDAITLGLARVTWNGWRAIK